MGPFAFDAIELLTVGRNILTGVVGWVPHAFYLSISIIQHLVDKEFKNL